MSLCGPPPPPPADSLLRVRGSQWMAISGWAFFWRFAACADMTLPSTQTHARSHAQSTAEGKDYVAMVAALLDRKADPNARVRRWLCGDVRCTDRLSSRINGKVDSGRGGEVIV